MACSETEKSAPRCLTFGVVSCGLKVFSPTKRSFCGKKAATNLARLFLLTVRSNCVKELNASDVESSCGLARLGTRTREKRYSKDWMKNSLSRTRGPLKVTRGLNESIGPARM